MAHQHLPHTDPPFFFRRIWSGGTDLDEVTVFSRTPDGMLLVTTGVPRADVQADVIPMPDLAPPGLVIYGRAVMPTDPQDQVYVASMTERGQVFSLCYSVVETVGEVGTHPLATVTEISRDEFEAARERGWT